MSCLTGKTGVGNAAIDVWAGRGDCRTDRDLFQFTTRGGAQNQKAEEGKACRPGPLLFSHSEMYSETMNMPILSIVNTNKRVKKQHKWEVFMNIITNFKREQIKTSPW